MDQPILTRVEMTWFHLGIFQSIYPIIKYQSKKATGVANALSQSQCHTTKERDEASKAIVWEEVLLLSSNSAEPQVEDIKKYRKAYHDDSKLKIGLNKLPQFQ